MTLEQPTPLELSRRSLRARRSRRSTLTALASTLVFATVLYLAVTSAPGWPRTQATFLNPQVAWESLPKILEGLWLNIRVLAVAAVATLVLALVVALLRTLRGPVFLPLRLLATGFVDLFRGIPLIVLLYLIGFGVPALRFTDERINPVYLGTVALVLTYAAYVSEVFRAGIDSVHPSQRLGARSLGLQRGVWLRGAGGHDHRRQPRQHPEPRPGHGLWLDQAAGGVVPLQPRPRPVRLGRVGPHRGLGLRPRDPGAL